jgi:hypothetical protein
MPGGEVGDDVAVEVRQHEHVVLLRSGHQLIAQVVDDAVLELDLRVPSGDLASDFEKQSVRELHDVGLVDRCHLVAVVVLGVLEGRLDDAVRAEP